MAQKKQRKMVALKVLETSGVDHPAHLEEGWIVMKSAETEDTVAEETEVQETEEIVAEETEGVEAEVEATEEIGDDAIERIVELEAALSKARERIASLETDLEKAKPKKGKKPAFLMEEEDMEEDDMMKSVPEPVREMLNKARSEAEAAREELRKERETQRDREYVAKAAGWGHLTIEADSFGPALRQVADIAPTLAETIEKALEAANAQQEAAAIFGEIGAAGRPNTGNAYGQVESLAKAAVEKGEYKTVEQAIAGLVSTNPALYQQYRAEQRG